MEPERHHGNYKRAPPDLKRFPKLPNLPPIIVRSAEEH